MFFVSQNFEHINKLTRSKQNHKRISTNGLQLQVPLIQTKTIEYETLVKPLYFHYTSLGLSNDVRLSDLYRNRKKYQR